MPRRADADPDDASLGSVDPRLHPPMRFPDADWAWFLVRCTALGIAGADARRPLLETLYGHLHGVNRWLNLTKLTTVRDYLKLHVLDSLAAVPDARFRHLAEGAPCADLGSGGGYPGLPLAAWSPRIPWFLIDARRKKAEFLAAAGPLTGNPACTGAHLRGGDGARDPRLHRRCQLVTSRAMAETVECMREAAPLLRRHGHLMVWKGPAFAAEERPAVNAACAQYGWRLVAERPHRLEESDPERVLVVLERLE
jgi:16S rRNA (guanine527-N7)-methyltransferase